MEPLLQFALTFVTLVVLTVIVYSRLVRYEKYMREEKDGIQRLNERLQSLADSFEAVGTKRVEQQLSEIHDALERIAVKLERPVPVPAPPVAGNARRQSEPPGLAETVEAKLFNLGYREVAIVTDVAGVEAAEPVRIVVEAAKDGVRHKGHLVVLGTTVTELEMQPSYTSFP